ncbi:hypothetical protein EV426DRAFT_526625 [Tirmania nivea]|nr:hypothetical protein EV426DRAFT_526625 [Tirmania nivea]
MGEWYTNAEFCIVHLCYDPLYLYPALDTNGKNQPEHTWTTDFYSNESEPLTITRDTNYECLDGLLPRPGDENNYKQPYWTKRGWTLQELCLSRKAYYFNNKWKQLKVNAGLGDHAERERRIIASVSGVPQSEVCRGGTNSAVSAFELLGFASHRQCTIPVDRIYSTMGMLGVKFVTFNAEGPSMALNRLLDHVVSLTRDVSVFNWSGANNGSTIPGRSLYPASLEPFNEGSQTVQVNNVIHMQQLQKQTLQSLNSLKTIQELMALDPSQGNISLPVDAINKILSTISSMGFDRRFSYEYVLLRRLLRLVQSKNQKGDEQTREGDALKRRLTVIRDTEPSDPPPPYPPPPLQAVENPTPPQVEESTKLPNQGLSGFGMRKLGLGKMKGKDLVPESLMAEKTKSRFSGLLSRESFSDDKAPGEGKSNSNPDPKRWLFNIDCDDDEEDVEARKDELPGPMISPNPLIVSTSGIEGLFDIQRVVVDILNASPVESDEAKISEGRGDARYIGKCLISTGLSQVTVGFSCTANLLMKQLDLRDLISQTELKEHSEQKRNVREMLWFVKERDIELVAGEWVLARFSGVPGAHWFLCLLELGDTHPFYGWRIPTDLIDFSLSTYEPCLVELWHGYMKEKTKLLCKWIEQLLKQRKVSQDRMDSKRERDNNNVTLLKLGVDGTRDVMTGRSTVAGAVADGLHKVGRKVEADVAHLIIKKDEYELKQEEYQVRFDLRSKALNAANIGKEEQPAVLSLDDNSVLPTMYFPSMRVHMF